MKAWGYHYKVHCVVDMMLCRRYTGGIEKFSADKNIKKILKVSHFYLEFS